MTERSIAAVKAVLAKNLGMTLTEAGHARNALTNEILKVLPEEDFTLRHRYKSMCKAYGRQSATIRRLRDEILAMRRKLDLPKLLDEKDAEIVAATLEAERQRQSKLYWYQEWVGLQRKVSMLSDQPLSWYVTKWWRVLDFTDNSVWCETSVEKEARNAMGQIDYPVLQRMWQTETKGEWRPVE